MDPMQALIDGFITLTTTADGELAIAFDSDGADRIVGQPISDAPQAVAILEGIGKPDLQEMYENGSLIL